MIYRNARLVHRWNRAWARHGRHGSDAAAASRALDAERQSQHQIAGLSEAASASAWTVRARAPVRPTAF